MIAEASSRERHGNAVSAPRGWFGRFRARTAKVAESIAEQKTAGQFRKQDAASFHYPDDLEEGPGRRDSARTARTGLQETPILAGDRPDVDGRAYAGLFFVPGPNIIGYYFAFRVGLLLSVLARSLAWAERHRVAE